MNEEPRRVEPKRRSVVSRLLELAFWAAIALITAWVLIENVERILPANNF